MANTYPRQPPLQSKNLTIEIPDISSADQRFVAPGFSGKITRVSSALNGSISGSDATLTPKISGTAVTGGAITVAQSGSGAGDVDSSTPTGANTFTATDNIEIETDGGSTGAVAVVINIECEVI